MSQWRLGLKLLRREGFSGELPPRLVLASAVRGES